jgi:hypothetical protein
VQIRADRGTWPPDWDNKTLSPVGLGWTAEMFGCGDAMRIVMMEVRACVGACACELACVYLFLSFSLCVPPPG